MTNSRASNQTILLFDHKAPSTSADLTIPLADITAAKYSKIIIHWEIVSSATFDLEMILNADTSGYGYTLVYTNGTVNAWTTATSQSEILLMTTTLNSSASYTNGTVEIQLPDIASSNKQIYALAMRNAFRETCSGFNADNAPLTEIRITTSTSTWAAGSRFTVYGIRR